MGQLITRQIPALFNGISQQPATLRSSSQCEAQVNATASVVDGLRKRPPFEHVQRISTTSLSGALIHCVDRTVQERYIVVITNGDLKVFDLEGNEQTVLFPLGRSYLAIQGGADAGVAFSVTTIADYSFVVNKSQTVATKVPPEEPPPAHNNWYFPSNWFAGRPSDLYLDSYYNPPTLGGMLTVQTFNDLPPTPAEGQVVRVSGHDADGFSSYYVVRRGGVWQETYKAEDRIGLDEMTMPFALINEGGGVFRFTVFPWKTRQMGDSVSNPLPTFVGRTINDVFFYKNRLGFLAGENVIFSAAGDFGNFFRTTVTQLLDSDLVDVAASTGKISDLMFAVPFNNGLMLFSDQRQAQLNVDEILTPSSVSIDTATEFEMSTRCKPVSIGTSVYFATEAGDYSRVREYFVDEETLTNDAADITAHVPRYLPSGITKMTGSSNGDMLFAISRAAPNKVFAYRFFWTEDTKVQSCWDHWEIAPGCSFLSVELLGNYLYGLIERADGVYLERANIQPGAQTGTLGHQVLLDRLVATDPFYMSGTDRTAITLPYPVESHNQDDIRIVLGDSYGNHKLALIDPSQYQWENAQTVTVPGNRSGLVWAGQSYTMRYTFSEQYVMQNEQPVTSGRLMMRTFILYFTDTAFFSTEVAPYGIDPQIEEVVPSQLSQFTGKTIGSAALRTSTPIYASGTYRFQIYGDSRVARVALVNDSYVQSIFTGCEWEGLYHNRATVLR